MKTKIYVRLARDTSPWARQPIKVDASVSPRPRPLQGSGDRQLHTLHFAVQVSVPDELLKPADWPVIELALTPDLVQRVPIEVEPIEPEAT